jgi:hypothetical protein
MAVEIGNVNRNTSIAGSGVWRCGSIADVVGIGSLDNQE